MHVLTIVSWLLAHYALAQVASPSPSRTSDTTTKAAGASATTSQPVVSLFLPMGSPDHIQASIITANANQTVFLLGCSNNTTSSCGYNPPITVTEGESTLIFTNTRGGAGNTLTAGPMTYQCELVGAHLDITPIEGAISAVCTASSVIRGLGVMATTSTLASTEIVYRPVTVTAGASKLIAASTILPEPTSNATSTAGASTMTAGARLSLSGVVGLAVLGLAW
ncbi:hypothetical protein DOTSEDRAFT_24796 [Dothistroma septosporum NZE10]|uniref:GPI anchored protein n=1 Tax=Dothistroma septosporum (strain NZE10 / CBS 128990) TaxID=675120 RepID=N1PR27_DOTSN|nr:hypothetical protein DOTSEDRAFT_24796 [Dothistroma septosporum NZE10]